MKSSDVSSPLVDKALRYIREGKLDKFMALWAELAEEYGEQGAVELLRAARVDVELSSSALHYRTVGDCTKAAETLRTVRQIFGRPVPVAA